MNKFEILLIIIIILAFLGFLDSTYLTILHYQNTFPPCSITHGCETVQTSQYATIGNIPVALLGSVYYLVLTVFSIIILQLSAKRNPKSEIRNPKHDSGVSGKAGFPRMTSFWRLKGVQNPPRYSIFDIRILTRYLFLLSLTGFLASAVFFSLQAFVIRAFCQYCLLAELLSTIILTLSIVLVRIKK